MIGLVRRTTKAVQFRSGDRFLYIRGTSNTEAGCFYWVQGRALPAAKIESGHLLQLPAEIHEPPNSQQDVIIVEGPFGPNVGIYSWLCRCLGTLLHQKPFKSYKAFSSDKLRELLRRPAQLPKSGHMPICLIIEVSAIMRGQSLWAYLRSSSLKIDQQTTAVLYMKENWEIPERVLKDLFEGSEIRLQSYDEMTGTLRGIIRGCPVVSKFCFRKFKLDFG